VGITTIDIIEMLEHDLKKPVISSNQATMWQLLRMVQINEPIHGFGRLLTE
jgi:maleate cis-trans isomerase